VLAIFGVTSIARGLDGRSTVHSALRLEGVVGSPPRARGRSGRDAAPLKPR
jgi:hypothetical protein